MTNTKKQVAIVLAMILGVALIVGTITYAVYSVQGERVDKPTAAAQPHSAPAVTHETDLSNFQPAADAALVAAGGDLPPNYDGVNAIEFAERLTRQSFLAKDAIRDQSAARLCRNVMLSAA